MQHGRITLGGGKEKIPDHASLTAHKTLTLAYQSVEKLLKSISCHDLLSGKVSESYGHFANLPL